MTHQLTDEQRKLLEDCPREKLEVALAANMPTIEIWEDGGGEVCACTSRARRSIGIPATAVEAWLAEQDKQEAEIERRIGEAISHDLSVRWFEMHESNRQTWGLPPANFGGMMKCYHGDESSLPEGFLFVPRERIRAAIDKQRAEQQAAEIPEPVEISDDLRRRLEKDWDRVVANFIISRDIDNGTCEQARAFLREKGIEP